MNRHFNESDILIPKNVDMYKWCVIACDQHTSEIDYWNKVKEIVGTSPSTLSLILPEIYLEDNVNKRIKEINNNMKDLINKDFFIEYKNTIVYLERTLSNKNVRQSLIGAIDLEDYSYEKNSKSLIRPTENTIKERVEARVKIRKNALLELPHILLLVDDRENELIEPLKDLVNKDDIIYDTDLMLDGGHVRGYKLSKKLIDEFNNKIEKYLDINYYKKKYDVEDNNPLLFAVGDGNHSLAAAKECYEIIKKKTNDKKLINKNRYVLVELINVHNPALEFKSINRVIYNTNIKDFLNSIKSYYSINEDGLGQKFRLISKDYDKTLYIYNPKSNIVVGSIELFLEDYKKENDIKVDYIHGLDTVKKLCNNDNTIGIVFDSMNKEDLFKTVILEGVLPKKTFSIGNSNDKRYYLESRKIS